MTRAERRLDPFTIALARADLWPVALAGFLVRGGVVLFILPIVVVPSPLDVANLFGPIVTAAALGGPNPALVQLAIVAVVVAVVVIVTAFLLGALADVAVTTATADALGRPAPPERRGVTIRAFAVRLLALVPFALVLGGSIPAIVDAVYRELISPTDLVTPLVVRVVLDVPALIGAVIVTWLLGEAIGGLATRLVVRDGRSVRGALAGALALAARRPIATLVAFAVGDLVLVALVAPALAASGLVWRAVAFDLRLASDPLPVLLATLALVALWLGGLVLAAFAATLRALLWTGAANAR
ncbi:MAG TPA: hypothetical protein VFI28_05625 [Candidatus Limnocylindrales bacterium]|nr:hypothetical protein [Candidatus Limnocylindrales bacterium]